MSRTVYVNGHFLAEEDAQISIFDRGFLFADAIYEVTSVVFGRLIDYPAHIARLKRSLNELEIICSLNDDELLDIHRQIVARNQLDEGLVYLQISRGVANRDFVYSTNIKPTVIAFSQAKSLLSNPQARHGISIISVPDERWQRRDIKTVQLLASSMAKMAAKAQTADDAWLVEDGFVTEGSSNTAHIIKDGVLITRPLSTALLPGVTRLSVIELAKQASITVEERPFTIHEAQAADEAFITSATSFVLPVVTIDDQPIGNGQVGPLTQKLRQLYIESRLATAL